MEYSNLLSVQFGQLEERLINELFLCSAAGLKSMVLLVC